MRRSAAALAVLALAGLGVVAAPASTPAAAVAQGRTVTIGGSTTMLPLVADLVFYYRREVRRAPRFELRGGGTRAAPSEVLRGIVTAGMVSRERTRGDDRRLVFTPIARSAICLVTNVSNPLPGLSRSLLQDLVSGRVTDWEDVPGATATGPIAHAGLPIGGGGHTTFLDAFVDPATPVLYAPRTFPTGRALRSYLLATPGALGYIDLAFVEGLHPVAYDGIGCTRRTVVSGAYPARRSHQFVTRGRPPRALRRFFRWIRTSPTARRVIATRYVRVGRQRSPNSPARRSASRREETPSLR